ncbi:gamma-glutamyl-gamma-aminobutyrate hydrolase [Brucella endophytica]|uniref:gamma-glutamyl-gamma-aminobutyrate hydrolase n=1 Tax=Brucella endophytica TaxID=1963359 RepID=A0A916SEN4_9HYPH|nr:gamma-glutamyl-gamma-aminobutyrate hydrolase family protein [Brucella endophytica]GGA96469.1 gamma-glutamyl-gamma-aminobutyrate hydrolase [Brucella endophytica]
MSKPSKPLIAVTSDVRSFDIYTWHAAPEQYLAAAVEGAGVTPLLVPCFGDALDLDAILAAVDGVLITGSKSNVHPSLYGIEPTEAHEPFDHARDATSLPLIRRAIELGVPLLTICRGFQELNVALGGTLATEIQELPERIDHRAPDTDNQAERFALRHPVVIKPGSCLASIVEEDTVQVNSAHRQGIDTLAPRLEIEALAEDGTIEAVSVKDAKGFVVGVQWHPEVWVKTDSPSRKVFAAFGDAVRAHRAARTAVAAE